MADKKLQRAIDIANEFVESEAGKQALKPVPKAKPVKENWVQKLKKKVKGTFASGKKTVKTLSDPNTVRTKDTEHQLYSSGLTPEEVASLRGKKKK